MGRVWFWSSDLVFVSASHFASPQTVKGRHMTPSSHTSDPPNHPQICTYPNDVLMGDMANDPQFGVLLQVGGRRAELDGLAVTPRVDHGWEGRR